MAFPAIGALGCGLCFGIVDRWMAHGPASVRHISNLAALWLAVAVLAGMTSTSVATGATFGFVVLVGALIGYYGWIAAFERSASLPSLVERATPWFAASTFVGPAFGWLGTTWGVGRSRLAASMLASAFLVDGIAYIAIDGREDSRNVVVHLATALFGIGLGSSLLLRRRRSNEFRSRMTLAT